MGIKWCLSEIAPRHGIISKARHVLILLQSFLS